MFLSLRKMRRFSDAAVKNRSSTQGIEEVLTTEKEMQHQDTSLATQQGIDAVVTEEKLEAARQAKARLDEQLFIKKSVAKNIKETLVLRELGATIAKDRLDNGVGNYSKDGHTSIFQQAGFFQDSNVSLGGSFGAPDPEMTIARTLIPIGTPAAVAMGTKEVTARAKGARRRGGEMRSARGR